MKIKYDAQVDAAYISFKKGPTQVTTIRVTEDLAIDLGPNEEIEGTLEMETVYRDPRWPDKKEFPKMLESLQITLGQDPDVGMPSMDFDITFYGIRMDSLNQLARLCDLLENAFSEFFDDPDVSFFPTWQGDDDDDKD